MVEKTKEANKDARKESKRIKKMNGKQLLVYFQCRNSWKIKDIFAELKFNFSFFEY